MTTSSIAAAVPAAELVAQPTTQRPLLIVDRAAWTWDLAEPVGLAHRAQVIAVPLPPAGGDLLRLRDALPGHEGRGVLVAQRSRRDPAVGFLHLADGLPAAGRLHLALAGETDGQPVPGGVTCRRMDGGWELGNGRFVLRLVADGAGANATGDGLHPGPLTALRIGDGQWRGRTLLDTRSATCRWHCALEEAGPLRAVWRGRAALGGGRSYTIVVTVDAGQDFARIEEHGAAGTGDQVVWDFAGRDLPQEFLQADTGAGHTANRLHWGFDRRLARLSPWTQFSQLSDLADGFALVMPGGDAIGAVTLTGGTWRGRRLDHLEAWVRRFPSGDDAARRGEPPEAKADLVHPDHIAARGVSRCAPHLCWEGWLAGTVRTWALVLAPAAALHPPGGPGSEVVLGHFDQRPTPAAWRAQQGLLRRIHVQHGLMPLQEQLDRVFACAPAAAVSPLRWPHPQLAAHHDVAAVFTVAEPLAALDDYLEARVRGFWEGAGAAAANVVVGRAIVPRMLLVEWLESCGGADPRRLAGWRARLAFLAHLYASDHFYPGDATMRPLGDHDGTEPTLQGMANQNFYTDALCVPGMFAEVFAHHPQAAAWRAWAAAAWSRQLGFHMQPESGVWEESHTYFQHVVSTVLPWLLRRADQRDGGFADPRLHLLLAGAVRQLTPRDADLGGRRALLPLGDHHPDPQRYGPVWAGAAEALAPHEPVLAGHLAWMAGEMGAPSPTTMLPAILLPSVPPPALCLGNDHLAGLGVLLRGSGPDGAETLLALRTGGAWGHHHADDGALVLYGAGRLLLGDAARFHQPAGDGRRKFSAEGHSRWAPLGLSPRNHLYRFTRGLCVARGLDGPLPWALAWSPVVLVEDGSADGRILRHPLHHHRLVVALAPGVWLVSDRWSGGVPGVLRFHCPGTATIDGATATCGPLTISVLTPLVEAVVAGTDQPRDRPECLTSEVRFQPHGDGALTVLAIGAPAIVRDGARLVVAGRTVVADERQVVVDGVALPRSATPPV